MNGNREGRTILVIDDDEMFLSALVGFLKNNGYNVITAINGFEGLKLLKSAIYDLVITDINMPFISGLGMITTIKKRCPSIPTIAMTGFGKEALNAAKEERADVALSKPFSFTVLQNHIKDLLGATIRV